jgi:hypothetical protein
MIEDNKEKEEEMATLQVISFLAALMSATMVLAPAYACPSGYVACGGACCPR